MNEQINELKEQKKMDEAGKGRMYLRMKQIDG